MFTKRLTEMNAERPYRRPISLLGRCWRRMNITTHGHRVRATGCKGGCQISRLTYKAMHEDLESTRLGRAQTRLNIYVVWMTICWEAYEIDTRSYMIDHHRRLWYREQKLQSMPRSQARFIRADWARMTTEAASKPATMITDGLGLRNCSWWIERARVLAHLEVKWVWPVTGMLTS